jgi:ATP-binding cassette, subfamily G (WHITE), eye pigment precursor transporter
LFKDGKEYR